MVFSSLVFLCIFLPIVFASYYIIKPIFIKNILLIIASLLFYAYGEPIYVLLMVFSTIFNYFAGRKISHSQNHKKAILVASLIVNFALLGVFKYADMVIGTVNDILSVNIPLTHIALPIGISFFTFQAVSYIIDVYRGQVEAQKNYFNILLYISFFPQLIAGPIVKYHDIEKQINNREFHIDKIAMGLRRFILGLTKKVIVANTMGAAVDALMATNMDEINVMGAWIIAIAYTLQIYFDFSGYSDMAIGLGAMFGFTFLENFNYPYSATSVQGFWRRWHMSLTTWFKEYLYIPLGGNRKGNIRTSFNKIVVFLTTGLWHGANFTFIFWGIYHGAFLLFEQYVPKIKKLPKAILHIYTLLVVSIGFVIFRADTLSQGFSLIGKMFAGGESKRNAMAVAFEQITPMFILALIIGVIISMPLLPKLKEKLQNNEKAKKYIVPMTYIVSGLLLLICMLNLSSGTYNPFIYFKF